jgi:uncharacterized protein
VRRTVVVFNRDRGSNLGERIRLADRYWSRLRGLLGRKGLEQGEGLLIVPSRGIHMWGMRFPLDVLLLDNERKVRTLHPGIAPGESTGFVKGVRYALEVPVGTIEATGTQVGDNLEWETA